MLLFMHMTAKHVCATGRGCEGRLCTVHLFTHFVCLQSFHVCGFLQGQRSMLNIAGVAALLTDDEDEGWIAPLLI